MLGRRRRGREGDDRRGGGGVSWEGPFFLSLLRFGTGTRAGNEEERVRWER